MLEEASNVNTEDDKRGSFNKIGFRPKQQNIEILKKSSNKFDNIFSKLPTLDSKEIENQLNLVKNLWKDFYRNIKVIVNG